MPHRVTELQCIMPIGNLPSVMLHGVLSFERAAALPHRSVALPEVQDRRDRVRVPGGLSLHEYANLYFHARNPMMFRRRDEATGLCVLRVSPAVLQLENVVLTDQNAASDYVRFLSPAQLGSINFDMVYARDWRHADRITYFRQKAAKCAEVLVPHGVPYEWVIGVYVVDSAARLAVENSGMDRSITIEPDLFFR